MKLKTRKTASKRFRITGRKKVMIRTGGQDHFNSRESSNVTTNKRRDKVLSRTNRQAIKQALPYI